ncbi:hypothetical protein GCM10009828_031250 [Actinoplanes couchii]|uniref:Uncharacterized protein n=1 Tax=Actinoplanes couchii TaxID=403638 RepID=A0ABQ3XBS4_9ACTN|nr:hypothetical protein Aco03nite_043120 [Actinoplanes couchii]
MTAEAAETITGSFVCEATYNGAAIVTSPLPSAEAVLAVQNLANVGPSTGPAVFAAVPVIWPEPSSEVFAAECLDERAGAVVPVSPARQEQQRLTC